MLPRLRIEYCPEFGNKRAGVDSLEGYSGVDGIEGVEVE